LFVEGEERTIVEEVERKKREEEERCGPLQWTEGVLVRRRQSTSWSFVEEYAEWVVASKEKREEAVDGRREGGTSLGRWERGREGSWAQRVDECQQRCLNELDGLRGERNGNDGVGSGKEENDENPDGDEGFFVVCWGGELDGVLTTVPSTGWRVEKWKKLAKRGRKSFLSFPYVVSGRAQLRRRIHFVPSLQSLSC
jgi:hypothetical protein